MDWKHLLVYSTGTVDQELLLRNEYLMTENRILRNQIKGRVQLSDGERKTLAETGQKLGKQARQDVAKIVKPDTILGWHRALVARKCDGSAQRKSPCRPTIDPALAALTVRMARENRSWGYDRIVGALANLGHTVSDQTVGNMLKRHGEEEYMGTVTVDQILAEAKTLSRAEQQHVRDTLDTWLRPERLEEQLECLLYEAGLRRDIRPPGAATVSAPRYPPVPVSGQPVSETLIEERR